MKLIVLFSLYAGTLIGQTSSDQALSKPSIVLDYEYGFAPVALEATRAVETAVPDATTTSGKAPINQFSHRNTLATPGDHFIVRPNADTLYTTAWLNLSREPIVVHVPDTAGRYYVLPLLDAYSNEIDSIGSRTTGTGTGNIAIVGPLWKGAAPEHVSRVIQSPTNTVWIIGRTLVRGQADLANAVAITNQYQLIPLSAYREFLRTGSYTPPTGVPVTPPNPDFVGQPVTSSQGFSKPEFFNVLFDYALRNPPLEDTLNASALVLDGLIRQNQLTSEALTQAETDFAQALGAAGMKVNGWSIDLNTAHYGTNYALRGATALAGLGAIQAADAVYPGAKDDIAGNSLTGANSYVIHFAPGQTPPAHGFWSITAYDHGFLVVNPINRYDVGSETGLIPNPDGSIDIFIQNPEPTTRRSNWLPVPAGAFTLTMRIYWPDQSVLNGTWKPPAINRVSAPLL